MFEIIGDSFKSAVNKLRFVDDEKALKNALDTLKKALLKADVYHKVVKDLLTAIENEVKSAGIGQKHFLNAVKSNLEAILTAQGKNQGFVFAPKPPTIVLMCGLQGGGKTTSTVKLANYLKLRQKKVLIAACDLQRLAAVEQLKQLCAANELEVFFMEGETNPLKVAVNALKKAKSELYEVLLVDTAGRLAIDEALMSELAGIKESLQPNEIFYVADAMSGQDGVKTAASFDERLNLTGVILSKFDADTKGGVALGIARQLGVPLRFIGVGEKAADLEVFIPERIVSRIMGQGDLASLAEKTAAVIDEKEVKKMSAKIKNRASRAADRSAHPAARGRRPPTGSRSRRPPSAPSAPRASGRPCRSPRPGIGRETQRNPAAGRRPRGASAGSRSSSNRKPRASLLKCAARGRRGQAAPPAPRRSSRCSPSRPWRTGGSPCGPFWRAAAPAPP